uniref:Arm DNA-binding domain-containing protein n=1 Tax=Mucilaginibacter sp. Bleaf8 TaxID=2834430 RepID=UPI0032DE400C
MRAQLNLLFYLKKRSNYQSGPVAIYLRFNVNGQRSETSTGKICKPHAETYRPGQRRVRQGGHFVYNYSIRYNYEEGLKVKGEAAFS